MTEQKSEPTSRGFVFAATGEVYVTLARRAARSLRLVHPDAEIDLFTDAPLDDPVFSQMHVLSESWFRPKMEALLRSRFERTVFLDADVMVIADLTSMFDVLDRFDFAAVQDRYLNNRYSRLQHRHALPDGFPVLNAGVLAVRHCPATDKLIEAWESEMKATGARRDQPVLRELLYESDLRICVLPPGFNFLTFRELKTWWGLFGAPRVLHAAFLHRRREGPGDPKTPFTMEELVGMRNAARLRSLLQADFSLNPDVPLEKRRMNDPLEPTLVRWVRARLGPIYHRLRER